MYVLYTDKSTHIRYRYFGVMVGPRSIWFLRVFFDAVFWLNGYVPFVHVDHKERVKKYLVEHIQRKV